MINLLKNKKDILLLIALLSLAVLFVYIPSFINGNYFVGGGDVKTESFEFFVLYKRELFNALRNRTLPFYSWVLFLGNNIWASKTFYGIFDIYNLIMYVVPANYYVVYAIQCYLKIIVSGITMYCLLSYLFKDKKWILLGSLCYGLSSYAIYFTSEQMFLSSYSFMPLYFLGMEMYLKENKKNLFIVSTALLLLTHFYLFYAISLFSPIYFIYRYYNINKKLKGFIISALKLIGYYLIGVLICGAFILPSFFYMLEIERVGNFNSSFLFKDLTVLLHAIINTFVPSHTYIYQTNIFDQGAHALKEICLFCGSIIPLVIPQVLVSKDKIYKKSTIIVYVLVLILFLTPIGNSMMLGFSESNFRWVSLIILLNIITAVNCLENELNKKVLIKSVIIEILIIAICFIASVIYKNKNILDYSNQIIIFVITIVFITMNALLLINNKKNLVIALTVFELIFCAFVFGNNVKANGDKPEVLEANCNVIIDNYDYHNLKNHLDGLDEENVKSFYRTYISTSSLYWDYSLNFNVIYNLQGLTTYDSTFAPSFNFTRDKHYKDIVGKISMDMSIEDPNLINLYNTKYSITSNTDEIPFSNYSVIDDEYQGTFVIALNNDYQSVGRTYSKAISFDDFENKYELDSNLYKDSVITYSLDEVNAYMKSESVSDMYDIEYKTNSLKGKINCDDDSFVVIGVPYDEGWNVKVNNQKVQTYLVGGGLIGIPVIKGNNIIEMNFVPKGFMVGSAMSLIGICLFGIIIVRDKRKKIV